MRIAMLGLRGFPGVQGGVETHAEFLCPLLVEAGFKVHVIARRPYQPANVGKSWNGVRIHRIWAPKVKGLEAIVHTFLGVLFAGTILRPDILHIQAIGPAIFAPLARMFGLNVVVTHHGPDYDRQKWGRVARAILRFGERMGMRWSNGRIAISQVIHDIVQRKYSVETVVIPNGVALPKLNGATNVPDAFGLPSRKYVLLVSRFVPEKRHEDLIEAFKLAGLPGWKLALVGASDHPDAYVQKILTMTSGMRDVVCTGLQTGEALRQLYANAGMFVLPSSHEGLPIALLEALSYGLPAIASNIPANLEIGLSGDQYFALGAVPELARRIQEVASQPLELMSREATRAWVSARFDWREVANRTVEVYENSTFLS